MLIEMHRRKTRLSGTHQLSATSLDHPVFTPRLLGYQTQPPSIHYLVTREGGGGVFKCCANLLVGQRRHNNLFTRLLLSRIGWHFWRILQIGMLCIYGCKYSLAMQNILFFHNISPLIMINSNLANKSLCEWWIGSPIVNRHLVQKIPGNLRRGEIFPNTSDLSVICAFGLFLELKRRFYKRFGAVGGVRKRVNRRHHQVRRCQIHDWHKHSCGTDLRLTVLTITVATYNGPSPLTFFAPAQTTVRTLSPSSLPVACQS